ncbi:MAG: hypothetical protein ACK4KV_16630 [Rhodocyclaceae bacterium]
MPLPDLLESTLRPVVRVLWWLIHDLVFELLIQGAGYLLLRLVRPRQVPGETACTIVGLAFWAGLAFLGYGLLAS